MKARLVGLVLAIGGVVACGEGLLILNVDVHSFVVGSGQETVTYVIPPTGAGSANVSASNTPLQFSLPGGLSCSVVNTVEATVGGNLINTGATATLRFQVFMAPDSAGTYQPSALAFSVPPATDPPLTVSGSTPTPVAFTIPVTQTLNPLFTEPELWVRAGVQGQATNPTLLPVQGQGTLTALDLRIIIQDEVC